jgi:hypothetical protein
MVFRGNGFNGSKFLQETLIRISEPSACPRPVEQSLEI